MNEIKKNMILKALLQHSRIYPCASQASLEDCFTIEKGRIIFWFNTDDHSTHLMVERIF